MRLLCVLLSIIAGGCVGAVVLPLTAIATMILLGEATSLAMSVVRIIVNFGVAGLAAVAVYSETRRYLGTKLVQHA